MSFRDHLFLAYIFSTLCCLGSMPNTAAGQTESETFQSAYAQIRDASGTDRNQRYLDAIQDDVSYPLEVRTRLLEKMKAEYQGSENPSEQATFLFSQGYSQQLQENFDEALEFYATAEPFATECQKELPQIWFQLLISRGNIYALQGRLKDCQATAEAAAALTKTPPRPSSGHNELFRLFGFIALHQGKISEAVEYADIELAYGMNRHKPIICAQAIERLVGFLQDGCGSDNTNEIRMWLETGEEYLDGVDFQPLQVLYAFRWAQLAVTKSDEGAAEKVDELVALLEQAQSSFYRPELAMLYGRLGSMYRQLDELEKSYSYAQRARRLAESQLAITKVELILAETEVAKGELAKAKRRLEEQAEFVKPTPVALESWHRTSAELCKEQKEFEKALFHLNESEMLRKQMGEGSVSILVAHFEEVNKSEQQALRLVAKQQESLRVAADQKTKLLKGQQEEFLNAADQKNELLEARADLAVADRNRIGFLALFGIVALAILSRLYVVSRLRRESQKMNENLALKLQEKSRELEKEASKRHQLELASERKQRHEAIGQLAAGISHDFNNLLTVITNTQDILESDENLPPQHKPLLRLSSEATERATGIVSQLMSFAKAEPLDVQDVSIRRWLESSQALFASTLGDEINFTAKGIEGDVFVLLDETQLSTAMINLLCNARDAVMDKTDKTDKAVSLVIEREAPLDSPDRSEAPFGRVKLTVSDNGSGVAPELLPIISSPYVTTKEGIGVGLGLSMVSGFVEKSGGEMEVQSEENIGTQVTISFPCVFPQAPIERPAFKETTLTGGTILVVDDNDMVRESISGLLQSAGFEVIQANSGSDAVDWLDNHPAPLFVLSDIKMPGRLSGIELRRHINQNFPDIFVVLMTGHNTNNFDDGCAVIEKPFKLDELLFVFDTEIQSRRDD